MFQAISKNIEHKTDNKLIIKNKHTKCGVILKSGIVLVSNKFLRVKKQVMLKLVIFTNGASISYNHLAILSLSRNNHQISKVFV